MANKTKQPITVEVLPSLDRCAIVCMLRSNDPIGLAQLIFSLEQFVEQLQAKYIEKKEIELFVPEKKIIV